MTNNEKFRLLLASEDAGERRQGIIGLCKLQDKSVVKLLNTMQRQDPDPEIRELARRAITFIKTAPADPGDIDEITSTGRWKSLLDTQQMNIAQLKRDAKMATPPQEEHTLTVTLGLLVTVALVVLIFLLMIQ